MTDGAALDGEAVARLVEITGGDQAFVDELVDTYLDDAVTQLAVLRQASRDGDVDAMVRPAHSLKSSSESVGALGLADQCRALEADAKAGSVPDASDRVIKAERTFDLVREALLAMRASR